MKSKRLFKRFNILNVLSSIPVPAPVLLSDDTSLQIFRVNDFAVNDGDTYAIANGITSVTILAVPTHLAAMVGSITGDSDLITGDNSLFFDVVAEDGVTTREYNLTIRVLTTGLPEIITISFSGLSSESFSTNSDGLYFTIYSPVEGGGRLNFWFNTGNETPPPDLSGLTIQIIVPPLLDSSQLAAITHAALSTYFNISTDGSTITATNTSIGDTEDASQGTSPISITIIQQGVSPS